METSNRATLWRTELWRTTLNNPEEDDTACRWEVALHRLSQLLGLLLDPSPEEFGQIISGNIWDMIETYGVLTNQLGGQLDSRLHPKVHYGLKQIDQHYSEGKALEVASGFEASEDYGKWVYSMGKQWDHKTHIQEAVNYEDVTGKNWVDFWKPARRSAPIRIIIMGTSIKLAHDTTSVEFKKIMLEMFGFEENSQEARS